MTIKHWWSWKSSLAPTRLQAQIFNRLHSMLISIHDLGICPTTHPQKPCQIFHKLLHISHCQGKIWFNIGFKEHVARWYWLTKEIKPCQNLLRCTKIMTNCHPLCIPLLVLFHHTHKHKWMILMVLYIWWSMLLYWKYFLIY